MLKKDYISVSEAAKILGVSRITVFERIKKGEIEAVKIGRNYIVNKKSLGSIYQEITPKQRSKIEKAFDKAIEEYGEALKKLGRE